MSIVRDEKPLHLDRWEELEGMTVTVEYEGAIEIANGFAFAPVRCDPALDYREALGLPREPRYPLHMTIGNLRPTH